jgi:hypothetical protein
MNQTQNALKDFFLNHPVINLFLNFPNKTEKISIFPIVFLITLIWFALFLLVRKSRLNIQTLNIVSHIVRYLNSPITVFISLSSKLLREPIEAHYGGIPARAFFKKYWIQIIGAIFISIIFYFFSIVFLKLLFGINISSINMLFPLNLNNFFEIIYIMFKDDVYLNLSVLVLVSYLIVSYSKISFLEGEYWNTKKSGLHLFIPTSEWDETPKLSLPNEELLKWSFELEEKLLSNPKNDLIRIYLSSGYDSFKIGGNLEKVLKNPRKTWKILLLNPDSKGAKERAKDYFTDRASDRPSFSSEEDYLNGIKSVISNIINIKNEHNPNIELRLFDQNPQWRIIIFGTTAIIRGFGPGQRSDRAPMLIYEQNSTSLFHTYAEIFEDIWHNYSISNN